MIVFARGPGRVKIAHGLNHGVLAINTIRRPGTGRRGYHLHVGIYLKELRGKPVPEIYDLFDREVDQYIACRVKTGQRGKCDA